MKKLTLLLSACLFFTIAHARNPSPSATAAPGELTLREVRYDGQLSDDGARFHVELEVEATGKGASSTKLFEGDVAILPAKLPDALKIVREGKLYRMTADRAGQFRLKLDLVAKVQRAEPWNQVSFSGPVATISSVTAQANGPGVEVQLLSGTLLESTRSNGVSRVKGFLAADQTVALRWQSKVTEVARKTLLTVASTINAQVTPTVIKYTSQFHYDIVQGNAAQLTLTLPASQALTRLIGEQIRDWRTTVEGDRQLLTIEFIKPIEKAYDLTLFSEQVVESASATSSLNPPQPLAVERESGALTLVAEDTLAEIQSFTGLRQVNATGSAFAAYRFNARPFTMALKLKRIEPVITTADRVTARLEETRLTLSHKFNITVEKSGIYAIEAPVQSGFAVAEVRGTGIEDWKVIDGTTAGSKLLRVTFSTRLLGSRTLDVLLEGALKTFPERISIEPLRFAGATKETAQIGAASAAGIRLATRALAGLREMPVNRLSDRSDELLAYNADQPDWKLTLATERLPARILADVFNLVTIGDGLVGGSATIRYSLVNQGVQEFKIKLPAHCRNVEFTGPNIRRKERSASANTNEFIWTIGLQDKAWSGYTLVVTYDYQFDPAGATLPMAGVHTVDIEHETGSIAITTAASLQLSTRTASDTLRRLDEPELAASDRALITRAVVLAYQYSDDQYDLAVDVKRYAEQGVLEAVADRTQITSVLTEAGEMLTQASFMVKNNEKQFQRFLLPGSARLWGCYVNGQPAKPERDGDWVLVSLPREANRDQTFAVDILYAQTNSALVARWSKTLELTAPRTDVPNTYAEWQLFVPPTLRLSDFGGSMSVPQGTTYELLDAWEKFLAFYVEVLREAGGAILIIGILAFLVISLVISAVRRGWNGILTVLVVGGILVVLSAMLLPALGKAKAKAQRISSVNNLKQIGLAARVFSGDNADRLPASFDEMKNELGTDKIIYDPVSGERFTYLGATVSANEPNAVLAYSPIVGGACSVLYVDGSVEQMSAARFAEVAQRGMSRSAQEAAEREQRAAIANRQLTAAPVASASSALQDKIPTSGASVASSADQAPAAPPATSGIRSIRIELPQTGTPFLFTKVLNVGNDPLSIRARVMRLHTFQTFQMIWQAAAFVLGLLVWFWQWRRSHRNAFILAIALALIIGSVGSLLIQWRALHDALIVGFPAIVVAIIALLVWKYWPRSQSEPAESEDAEPPMPESPLPPVIAAIALGFFLFVNSASAGDSNVSILSANYSGTVNDRVALLDVTLQLSSAKAGQTVPLFGTDVAVQEFKTKSRDVKLVREANGVAVRLARSGTATLQLKLLAKVSGDVTKRQLTFAIPAALSSQVNLLLDQAEADVDLPMAVSFQRSFAKEKTAVTAVIGSGDRMELLWTPRVKRAAEVAATVFCENNSLVAFGNGVMNIHSTLNFQITQGELRQARVQLPVGQRLLRVEGAGIRTWEIKEQNGMQVATVDLLKGISPEWQLSLETERALDTLPSSVVLEVPHALEVKRETGLLALRSAEELGLSVQSSADLQRVDAEEFARTGQTDGVQSVFRFSKPEFALRVRAEAIQPQIEAASRNHVRLGSDGVTLSATIDYTIKRAGIFALPVALPPDYQIEQVVGTNISQWTERNENGGRVLEISLKERTIGAYSLRIELARTFQQLPASLEITGAHPINADKLTGFVSVSAEPGVAIRTGSFDRLTEIPAAALTDASLPRHSTAEAGSVLAYKFIASSPTTAPEWKLSVLTETVESWVRAEVVNTFTLSETLVSGKALVRFDVANAPVKEFRLRVPADFKNVEINGANIRSHSQTGEVWRVELQGKMRGNYVLTVTWEQPRAKNDSAALTGISAENVERETGLLAVSATKPLQVNEASMSDLQRVDLGIFPDWAGRPDETTALAYRYVRPGYKLAVKTQRFDEADVLQALVDNARFTTVVAEDGQTMTEMSLSVRNNGRQFLEVALPPGATVWSAFVAGQPVRPSLRNGKLLLPIQQTGGGETAISVDLTYVGANRFPRERGEVAFASPRFDVPLKNAHWELFLPPDFDYQDFKGTMIREPLVTTSQPSSVNFSLLEYSRMETQSKASLKAEAMREVSAAKRKLASGNVREATADFNRARGKFLSTAEDSDVKTLAKDLQIAQGSNLINAQNDFAVRNSGYFVNGQAPGEAQPMKPHYDTADAEQQWNKLQQAQEMVAAKVQPLRVNLPIRGVRRAFTQVLQTEVNKPMTIQLLAVSTKAVSWPMRLATAAAAFLLLWGAISVFLRMTSRRAI